MVLKLPIPAMYMASGSMEFPLAILKSLVMVPKLPMSAATYLVWFYLLLLLLVSWLLLCLLLTVLFLSSRSGAGDLLALDFSSEW